MKKSTKRTILHIFFPNRCPVCGMVIGAQERFCAECEGKLTAYDGNSSIAGSERFIAAYEYNKAVSPAVMLLKDGIGGNAAYALGCALADKLTECGISADIDLIVPVPLHKSDRRRRGFDQTELIAREVSEIIGVPVCMAAEKTHTTKAQKTLSRAEREKNLSGAFTVPKTELIFGRRVLVIDDVCTTGSTLAEVTAVLLKAGAAKVYCAACCKTSEK